jgi:hypothetical protein
VTDQRLFRSLAGPTVAAAAPAADRGVLKFPEGRRPGTHATRRRNDDGASLRFRSIPQALAKAQVKGGLSVSSRRPAPETSPRITHGPSLDNPRHRRFRRSEGMRRGERQDRTDHAKSIPLPRMWRRASTGKRPGQRPFSTRWQVQDSNLRRHTPTDLQNDAAHALTCGFTAPAPNFGTISPRRTPSADTPRRDGWRRGHRLF